MMAGARALSWRAGGPGIFAPHVQPRRCLGSLPCCSAGFRFRNFNCAGPLSPVSLNRRDSSHHAIPLPAVEEMDGARPRAIEGIGRSRPAAGRDCERARSKRSGGEGACLAARHRLAACHSEAQAVENGWFEGPHVSEAIYPDASKLRIHSRRRPAQDRR